MAEPQKKKPEPVTQDRYWRLPVYNAPLEGETLGQYVRYNQTVPLGRQLAELEGREKFIEIDPRKAPQSVEGSEFNQRESTMKHELAHVMQDRGGISPNYEAPLPDMGGGVLGWFLSALKDPAKAKQAAAAYQEKLGRLVGGREADAALLSDTVGTYRGVELDPEQQEVLRRMQIEELERQGQAKYTPIWKKPGEK